jgi:hypothetical protein
MLSRSSSFTLSYTESLNENSKSTANFRHHELLQNLQQTQRQIRPMLSRPLNIENNNQLHFLNSLYNEKKSEEQIDTIKRTIVQDDIENIQERLNEMLIAASTTNDNETLLLPIEQTSTTQYFTPKISIDENGKKKN